MTKTAFARMKKAVEKNGWFRIPEKDGYTEILKDGPHDYSMWSVFPGDKNHVIERYCFGRDYSLDRLCGYMIEKEK